MKKTFACAALISLAVVSLQSSLIAEPPFNLSRPNEQHVKWQANLQAAHKIATRDNKPMLLVFGAEWCHYCKKLERETLNSADLAKYVNETFVPVHLDADKEKKVAEILNISSLPCVVVLSPDADLLGRIDGFYTPVPFQKQLVVAKQKHQHIQRIASETAPTATR